jgi:hypothetical protein
MTINNTEESPYVSHTSHGSEILYVLTVEDLEGCYNDAQNMVERFEDLTLEERQGVTRAVKKHLESWAGDGVYTWADAIEDGIESYYMYRARYEGGSDAKV